MHSHFFPVVRTLVSLSIELRIFSSFYGVVLNFNFKRKIKIIYRKIPVISPGLIQLRTGFLVYK